MSKLRTNELPIMRVQFDVFSHRMEDLKDVMKLTGLTSRKDLFETAVALLEVAVKERLKGKIICAVDEENDNYQEILVAPLLAVKKGKTLQRDSKLAQDSD